MSHGQSQSEKRCCPPSLALGLTITARLRRTVPLLEPRRLGVGSTAMHGGGGVPSGTNGCDGVWHVRFIASLGAGLGLFDSGVFLAPTLRS